MEEENNVVKDESAIKKYISSRERVESDTNESIQALQNAIYEAISYGKVKDLSDAMYELTEHIAEINAKLTYRSYQLTTSVPPEDFQISLKDVSIMLDLYKRRTVYIVKRDLISRALSALAEVRLSPTTSPPSEEESEDNEELEKDISSNDPLSWESLLEGETLASFSKDPCILTELIPEIIIDFEKLVLQETQPLPLIAVLESIDKILGELDIKTYEQTAIFQSYEEKRKSVLIKRMMVLNRLKDILADT